MRIIIVSNRLPFTISSQKGRISFKKSSGGLVSGLISYLQKESKGKKQEEYLWLGWPGAAVNEDLQEKATKRSLERFKCLPVYLSDKDIDEFYDGFCNATIWPAFHYFPESTVYRQQDWETYIKVNKAFAEVVASEVKAGDMVWIHDYHLMLVPDLLRARFPEIKIGFFLHIPFPSFEIFRLLPRSWAVSLLEGLMGADLVGFHTYDYCQHFLRCVLRLLGHDHYLGRVQMDLRTVRVDSFPMGVDFEQYNKLPSTNRVTLEKERIKEKLKGLKSIFSVDRLDYTKGMPHRLLAYEEFLKSNPQWHEKVVLIMVVVPSRVSVPAYSDMKEQLDGLVGRINGKFGSVDWTPILYQFSSIPTSRLSALYSVSPVALVTPLRDGMNLVAKEYLASRENGDGVLILSEMTGAAQELGEALLINPNHQSEVSEAIRRALEMPVQEQVERNKPMLERLANNDVSRWAEDFLEALGSENEGICRKVPYFNPSRRKEFETQFKAAPARILFLDYDGTMVPFASTPTGAAPDRPLLHLLTQLTADKRNCVIIVSGRDRDSLARWFESTGVGLIAEHGAWLKEPSGRWFPLRQLTTEWKTKIYPIMRRYAERVPGSFIEDKESSLAWHYRKAEPDLGMWRARELIDDLISYTANIDVQVLEGKKVVEVRNQGVDKGEAARMYLSRLPSGSVLAVGDDLTDEDLFEALPAGATTIRVGVEISRARFFVRHYKEVRTFLESLVPPELEKLTIDSDEKEAPAALQSGQLDDRMRVHRKHT